MTSIDKYLKEFEDFFSGDLTEQEKAAFKNKLAKNSEMQFAWEEYQLMMNALSNKEALSFRFMLNKIYGANYQNGRTQNLTGNFWFRLSAAAIFIVMVGCLLYFFCTTDDQRFVVNDIREKQDEEKIINTIIDSSGSGSVITVGDSLTKLDSTDAVPQVASIYNDEKYQISPAFAELLHNVYRSNWFSLLTPVDSVIFEDGDSIVFSWESNIYEPLYFDVLDRHGKVIYKHAKSIESPWSYRPNLRPAIYMFRFSTKDQPVWMGVMVGVK